MQTLSFEEIKAAFDINLDILQDKLAHYQSKRYDGSVIDSRGQIIGTRTLYISLIDTLIKKEKSKLQ